MDLKGAEIRNIKNLCSEIGSKENIPMRVKIPYYQRPYKWGEENIQNLINDFFKNDENEYFVGSAVMVKENGKRHDVIDGQQRITTMFLLAYLQFLLDRAYVEELLNKRNFYVIDTALGDLESVSGIVLGSSIQDEIKKIHKEIMDKIQQEEHEDNWEDNLLSEYQKAMNLPEKNFSDMVQYGKEYVRLQRLFLKKCDLSLTYDRDSYNTKLLEALANFSVILSDSTNPAIKSFYKETDEDKLIAQYITASCTEFTSLDLKIPNDSTVKPMTKAKKLIDHIKNMVERIKLCVIITGNEKDAYTLFEVLNDRALEIEDLDLIKNLFYKWYCKHTDDTDSEIDETIEEVDQIWVEKVFPAETGKERSKMISFFAANFFTADDSLKFNDNERYREILENRYLMTMPQYSSVNIKNDIAVYHMSSLLIKGFGFVFQGKNEKTVSAETDMKKSITYRAFHLMNALKQYGVMPALSNIIIKNYINTHTDADGLVKIDDFDSYIKEISDDYKNEDPRFKDIHRIALDLWRFALLCPSADLPRKEAKTIISMNNVHKYDTSYAVSQQTITQMTDEFSKWINNWYYGKGDSDVKARVLLINLFNTELAGNKLVMTPAGRSFRTTNIQLDHMEAQKTGNWIEDAYFKPQNIGEQREKYIHCIGNIMILDDVNNNDKNNLPMEIALEFYDKMCAHHWMIEEIKSLLQDDNYNNKVTVGQKEITVPNEGFFVERTNRLKAYMLALLMRDIDSVEMEIK